MKGDKTTPAHDLTPRTDGDVTDSGSPPHSNRRTLLKKTGTITATAALATWLLPKQWQKPVIDVVGLPLHAQTSPAVATTAATTGATTTEATTTEATTTEATTTEATTTEATTTEATTTEATTTEATTTGAATTTAAPTMVTGYSLSLSGRTVVHNIVLTGPIADGDLSLKITFGTGIVTTPERTRNPGTGTMTASGTVEVEFEDDELPVNVYGEYKSELSFPNDNVVLGPDVLATQTTGILP